MNFSSIFRQKDNIVTRHIAGETILVPISRRTDEMQRIFALNPAAQYIWQQLDGSRSLEEIRAGIVDRFEVETEQAAADTQDFVLQLQEAGIIEEVT